MIDVPLNQTKPNQSIYQSDKHSKCFLTQDLDILSILANSCQIKTLIICK